MVHAPRLESRRVKCGVNVNFKLPDLMTVIGEITCLRLGQGGVETDVADMHNGDISPSTHNHHYLASADST